MKKKFLLICMAAMLALSLAACGGNDKKEDKKADKKEESVKKEEKDIELTLPASFFDEEGLSPIRWTSLPTKSFSKR